MAQLSTIGKWQTSIKTQGEDTVIRYWSTDVVSFNDQIITLKTGGWKTATTKVRMNQVSRQFGLGYSVYQKDFCWYVATEDGVKEFTGETFQMERNS
jgi:hypothetical protein